LQELFAMRGGRKVSRFASPRHPVGKPLDLSLGALVVLVVRLVVLAVVAVAELNRPNVTGADAAPPQLVRAGTDGIIPGISRLARRQQGEMPGAWSAIIREGAEAGVARQVPGQ
jgi:hypothetical protein